MQLAERRDVVEAGIGAGIRDHHQTVPYQHSAAISHSTSPNRPNYRRATSSQFRPVIQPQFPAAPAAPGADETWGIGVMLGSGQNDVRLDLGGDFAAAM